MCIYRYVIFLNEGSNAATPELVDFVHDSVLRGHHMVQIEWSIADSHRAVLNRLMLQYYSITSIPEDLRQPFDAAYYNDFIPGHTTLATLLAYSFERCAFL